MTGNPTAPADALLVLPLAGLPEVRPGDDLGALVADAVAATPGALPLRPDDVIVVTQKVVSKAEGAIVDLRTIEPRPEAVSLRGALEARSRARSRSSCARRSASSGWPTG